MKHIFTALLLLPAAAWAQKGFHIKGNIAGLKDSTEIVLSSAQNNTVITTAMSSKGGFDLNGQLAEPQLTSLRIGRNQPVYLYIENAEITLNTPKPTVAPPATTKTKTKDENGKTKTKTSSPASGESAVASTDMPNITQLQVEGSQAQVDFIQFQQAFTPVLNAINQQATAANSAADPAGRERAIAAFNAAKVQLDSLVARYVAAKPASWVSPFVLGYTAQILDNPTVVGERFRRLDPAIQKSAVGQSVADYVTRSLVGSIGSEAVDFTQNDTTGKPVALSSLRGKYVLLDFWASWCRPCRAENPNVVQAYHKFSKKNFTVLGVSLDQAKEPWLKAIANDNLTWTHVSDLQQWNNAVAKLYQVQGIPQNFLIDPQGRIVGKNLRGPDLEAKLCELLGCN